MIYFDNAATGGFKPRAVTDAAQTVIRFLSANPGRSGHRLSVTGAQTVYSCRTALASAFGATPDRVIFTKNCTEALNVAILGTVKKGGHVITTAYEHNSVLRPLHFLKQLNLIELDVVFPSEKHDLIDGIKEKIKQNTYMIATTAVSNVTGEVLPINDIGALAKKYHLLYLLDGAQGGGHIPIDLKEDNVSLLALAGHKGLYGIMGSGALLIGDNVDVQPVIRGGTGSESFNLSQPQCLPERLESGTLNLPAIAALNEGVRYAQSNLQAFSERLTGATELLIEGLNSVRHVNCYSNPNPSGIVSFSIDGIESGEVADILSRDYDVAVRGGFHCAPLIHKALSTDLSGLVRASLAVQNSSREIQYFLKAIKEIAEKIRFV